MSHNSSSKKLSFKNFILASILAHITLVCLMLLTAQFEPTKNKSETIEIAFIDNEIVKNKIVKPTLIVESDSANANNELAENAKFLSEKNNTVKNETKAKSGDKFHNAKKSLMPVQNLPTTKPQLFENNFDAYSSLNKKSQQGQKLQQQNTSSESSTTNDNLAKIENDLITRLNTKEYKYYGYYSRIKKQLNQWWVPKVQQKFTKILKQGRTIASDESKITKLVIVLNHTGHLLKVQVLAESGFKDLDDAAIEAFRSAAPFPNPPKGMVDRDGKVKIRWDCVVES